MLTIAKVHGVEHRYETLPNTNEDKNLSFRLSSLKLVSEVQNDHEAFARKAYGFWQHSLSHGKSDYLIHKGVEAHNIRFRTSHGNTAVIPMRDITGKLWSYQLLNADGSKLFQKGGRTAALFHCLANIINGKPFGIAESYVTAATCLELTSMPVVCAFGCHNLASVAKALNEKYPNSPIAIFADNDRHLEINQGLLRAQEAYECIHTSKVVIAPDFGDCPPDKSLSDWNDLMRLKGKKIVLQQLLAHLKAVEPSL